MRAQLPNVSNKSAQTLKSSNALDKNKKEQVKPIKEKKKKKNLKQYARRDSNSGFPACEAGVITRLDHARTTIENVPM